MGNVTIVVDDRVENVNDSFLLIVAMTVYRIVQAEADNYSALRPFLADWPSQWIYKAPGVVELRLEEIEKDNSATEELLSLLTITEQEFRSYGDEVPIDVLKSNYSMGDDIWNFGFPTERILKTIDTVRRVMGAES